MAPTTPTPPARVQVPTTPTASRTIFHQDIMETDATEVVDSSIRSEALGRVKNLMPNPNRPQPQHSQIPPTPSMQLIGETSHGTQNPGLNTNNNQQAPQGSTEIYVNILKEIQDVLMNKAFPAAPAQAKKDCLHLINIFDDYLSTGTLRKQTLVLQQQINQLDSIILGAKKISKTASQQPQPQPAPRTFAQAAAHNVPAQAPSQPQRKPAAKKQQSNKDFPKAAPVKTRQLVLIRTEEQKRKPFNPIELRNHINTTLQKHGVTEPVVSTVQLSLSKQNIIITTMPKFNAQYLSDQHQLWTPGFPSQFQSAQVNDSWYKVVIHGVPLNITQGASTLGATNVDPLNAIVEEIKVFNQLQIIGKPRWLTSDEKRFSGKQKAGSICVAFATHQEAQAAINKKLHIFGISCKAEPSHSAQPWHQCSNCLEFGHKVKTCKKEPRCQICAQNHHSNHHTCNTCHETGKRCVHSIISCLNCRQPHQANSKTCPVYQSLLPKAPENNDNNEL